MSPGLEDPGHGGAGPSSSPGPRSIMFFQRRREGRWGQFESEFEMGSKFVGGEDGPEETGLFGVKGWKAGV